MEKNLISTLFRVLTLAVFFLLTVVMLVKSIAAPDRERSEKENRSLAQFPEISLTSITSGDFMSRFESYMSDQVFGREKIVSVKSAVERLTGKTEQNGVYIGKDGWLFEKPAVYNQEKVGKTASAVSALCKRCGIENQMFVLVPNSTSVVEKKLPSHFPQKPQNETISKVYSLMPDSVKCFDANKIIQNYSDRESLYYRNDHHWTTAGAKLVFDGIASAWQLDKSVKYNTYVISGSFYGTLSSSSGIKDKPDTIEACVPENGAGTYYIQNSSTMTKTASVFCTDKLNTSNQYEVFAGGNFSKLVINTTADTDRRLLLFKDSYANCMLPMLTPHFREIVVIDARYFTDEIDAVIETEDFTHLLFLYNVNTFLDDTSLKDVLQPPQAE